MPVALVWVVRAALTGLMFVYFGVGSLLLSWVILPWLCRGERTPAERARVAQAVVCRGFRQFHALMRWARLVDFDPRTADVRLPPGPCVVIANHPTLVDITAVLAVMGEGAIVVRSGLFRSPFVGRLLRYCWNIDAGEGGAMAGAAVVQGAVERIEAGLRVVIFPEGTRSPVGSLRRFHPGAFEIAQRAGVPLVPLFITCDPPTLMKGVPWYALPKERSILRVETMALSAERGAGEAGRLFAREVQRMYEARLSAWKAGRRSEAPGTGAGAAH